MNDIHSQSEAYVVGGLSPDETRAMEAHLETCATCRSDVADLREVAVALSQSVATDPPAALRANVLAAIGQTPQEFSAGLEAEPVADDRDPHEQVASVVPLRRPRANVATALLAAASILAVIALGGYAFQSHQDAADATAQSRQLTALLSADDVVISSDRFVDADHSGAVVMSKSREMALLVASDLPEPPDNRVYEAWTFSGDKPTPAGTFTPDASQAVVQLPSAVLDADAVAITVEPDGGSDQPTSQPVFTVALPSR